ncbi:MAG: PepSY-associated TM helix domain-containing protein, partial [Pseudomonadota bacterium]
MVADAEAEWGVGSVVRVNIQRPLDANGRVVITPSGNIGALPQTRVYDATSGEYLESLAIPDSGSLTFASAMIGLHEGLFAGPVLRWLYFLSGLLGTAMVATGAIYWTAKRRKKAADEQHSRGFRFVEVMNIGTIMGVLVGVAAFFWANRLLPIEMTDRTEWEAHIMYIAWGVCLIYPLIRGRSVAWRDLTWLAAILFAAIPVLNVLTTNVGLFASIPAGDWIMAGFDLTALGFGVALAFAAIYMTRKRVAAPIRVESVAAEPTPS